VTPMFSGPDPRSDVESTRRVRLDGAVLVTCLLAALVTVGCAAASAWHAYDFVVLLLDRGRISARNAALFAAFAWLGGALALGFSSALLVRLMYRINGTDAAPADAVSGRRVQRGRPDRPGRRR
jgi:hypothetical protein